MRIYRLDYFLAEKADKEGKTVTEVTRDLLDNMGISAQVFSKLRNAEFSNKSRISPHLLKLSYFFNCPMDSLINPAIKEKVLAKA